MNAAGSATESPDRGLTVTVEGHIAVVELNRPPHNHLDLAMTTAIVEACERLETEGCRAIVLCSTGRHFCAGANLASKSGRSEDASSLPDLVVRLAKQPLPIVAAIQGAAVGAGFGLAMLADFRIATADARFAANFVRLGFHPGWGLSVTLPAAVGMQRASELMFTGRRIDAADAALTGVVDRLVSSDQLRTAAEALAMEIASAAPLAVRSVRETLRQRLLAELSEAVQREAAEQAWQVRTKDCREGITAMSERRAPVFRGE